MLLMHEAMSLALETTAQAASCFIAEEPGHLEHLSPPETPVPEGDDDCQETSKAWLHGSWDTKHSVGLLVPTKKGPSGRPAARHLF